MPGSTSLFSIATQSSGFKDTIHIDELLYSISTMNRFQELALIQPTYIEERIKKHLNLLDGIALLLVTESQSDVVATAFAQTTNSIKVEFARNSAVKISTNYVNQILNQLALLKPSDDRNREATKLVLIALKSCFPKIKQRTIKLWNACKKILPHEVTKENLDQLIKSLFDHSEGVQSLEVVLEFFDQLLSFSKDLRTVTERRDRAIWTTFLRSAYQVGKLKTFTTDAMYSDIQRRIAKLGDYFQATMRIVGTCLSPELRKYQHAITVEQIPTPPQVLAQVRNPLEILNHHRSPKDPEISIANFKRAYPSVSLHSKPINLKTSVHCELTVAMHKIKDSGNNLSPIEIGVSKHCCYMCGTFIKKINESREQKLLVSGLQGKAQAGWRFPPETPLDIQKAIMDLVRKEVDELRCFAESKRRSDSFPTGDSGDEERADDRKKRLSMDDIENMDVW